MEEVEYGVVVFDVYKYFFGEDEVFCKKMVFVVFWYIVVEMVKVYVLMCKVEGYFDNLIKVVRVVVFLFCVLG